MAGGGLRAARLRRSCPRTALGHLKYHIKPQRPQELWVMMGEVPLCRLEELMLGIAFELRPALAVCDPYVPFVDRGHRSPN